MKEEQIWAAIISGRSCYATKDDVQDCRETESKTAHSSDLGQPTEFIMALGLSLAPPSTHSQRIEPVLFLQKVELKLTISTVLCHLLICGSLRIEERSSGSFSTSAANLLCTKDTRLAINKGKKREPRKAN
ncbi:hypothetical protein KIN20_007144 [Parelaphostrongylus tenuis]|uniref:Uncharacterized protein n=1 Tax=Parelaphostrongylus tenuis TaxID=148309 RepID=A0AAD5QGM8_PARTN|nr:hypothetical protein KIN20_007144 [Parelaphostrongylus tenuis]